MLDWQQIVAILIALVASGYLGRRAWQMLVRDDGNCGSCASCPAESGPASKKQIVPLDALARANTGGKPDSAETTD